MCWGERGAMIRCNNVSLEYIPGKPVLKQINLHLEAGSFTFISGASGAGKSSLLSLMAGIMRPDDGNIFFSHTDITNLTNDQVIEWRGQNIAFIFQAFELIPNLTAEENIDLVLDISHAKRRYSTQIILEKVGLGGK